MKRNFLTIQTRLILKVIYEGGKGKTICYLEATPKALAPILLLLLQKKMQKLQQESATQIGANGQNVFQWQLSMIVYAVKKLKK